MLESCISPFLVLCKKRSEPSGRIHFSCSRGVQPRERKQKQRTCLRTTTKDDFFGGSATDSCHVQPASRAIYELRAVVPLSRMYLLPGLNPELLIIRLYRLVVSRAPERCPSFLSRANETGLSVRHLPFLHPVPLLHAHGHVHLYGNLGHKHSRRRARKLGAHHGGQVPYGEPRRRDGQKTQSVDVSRWRFGL